MDQTRRNARFYLDQNILGYIGDGQFQVPENIEIDWIYSDEHFNEISRGDAAKFLAVLHSLRARKIRFVLNDQNQLSDEATIDPFQNPFEFYEQYMEAKEEVSFDETIFLDVLRRIFGAENFESVSALPERCQHQIDSLVSPFVEDFPQLKELPRFVSSELNKTFASQLNDIPSLIKIRKALGADQLHQTDFRSDDSIAEIWQIIGNRFPGISIDQFFGFSPYTDGHEPRSTVSGIIGCHLALNLIGYCADRRPSGDARLRRTLSDGQHIAYAAFCEAVVSEDDNFCRRAKAIYSYANIPTQVCRLIRRK